jgi:ABC-type oligopeptide transport system substrate-binding subunit
MVPAMPRLATLVRSCALAVALATAGCGTGNDEAPRAELRVDMIGDLGPVVADATQVGLVDLDSAGNVVPGLATSWRVSDDGRSIIFRLRDAQWEDGRKLTAGDVVAVYRRVFERRSQHPLKELLLGIEGAPEVASGRRPPRSLGVNDPLPNIVEIRLTSPQPELLQLLAHPSMTVSRRGDPPPSNGAFTLADPAARPLVLRRNPTYFDAGAVALGRVTLTATADPVAAVGRYRRGEADMVIGSALAGLGEARTATAGLVVEPAWGTYGYIANQRRGALTDARVRRALAMAVERDAIVTRLFAIPAMAPNTGLTPATLPAYPDPARPDWNGWTAEGRLAEAQRLLAEAGYGADKPLTLRLALPLGREHAAVAAAVAAQWAPLGVRVGAETRDEAGHVRAIARGDFELALAERLAPADAPLFFLAPFRCGGIAGACNREAERLLDAARTAPDLTLRTQSIRLAERLLVDDTPAIMLFTPVRWSLIDPRVSGWAPNALGAHPFSRLDKLPEPR